MNKTRGADGTVKALTATILAILIVWTLLGNLAVCMAVSRYRHLRAKVTNIFIVSLALSDLLVAVLVMPWKAVAEVAGFWPFAGLCKTWLACDIMCSTASILNLCVISVDRYWAISSPFRYERTMTRTVALVMIAVTWTVSVVISFVPVQLDWHRADTMGQTGNREPLVQEGFCDSSLSRTYAISSSLISFYIPVVIMVVTYTRIYRIAHIQIRMISSLERAAEHAQSCRSDSLDPFRPYHKQMNDRASDHAHKDLRVSFRKETKVLKTLSVIMGVFVCCWLPFFVLNCAQPFCTEPGSQPGPHCVSEKTFDVFVWIGWSNSSLNPIIYAFNADFRDAFLRLLPWCNRYCAAFGTAVETMASNEAGHLKHKESPLDTGRGPSFALKTRGSENSGNTALTLLCLKGTSSNQVDTQERLSHIPM